MKINLLKETIKILEINGKTTSDVVCAVNTVYENGRIGYSKFDWKSFEQKANINYDNEYENTIIDCNLMIIGKDWWLERESYDGTEKWVFKAILDVSNLSVMEARVK